MSRPFTLVSISFHAIVIGGVYVAQTLNVGPLPLLHDALAFANPPVMPAIVIDPPTRPTPPTRLSSDPSISPNAAPLDAPRAVTPETGRENDSTPARPEAPAVDVEQGVDAFAPIGVMPGATLAPPGPVPQRPIPLHAGVQPPRKIVDAKPVYPALALTARQEGVVILETIIDARGGVETVRVLRGYPLLDQAAIEAVRQWRFTPALLNGQPVPVVMTVTVTFALK